MPLEDALAAGEATGMHELLARSNVFRVLLRAPHVARALSGMLDALLWKGALDARLRELAIMRIGWVTGSVYEWTQHWRIAIGAGLSEDDLVALRGGWRAHLGFSDADRAVLAATDETLETGTISDQTWAACAAHLSGEHLIELVVAIGNWRLFSSLLRSLDVPLDEGLEPWPPDGRAPG